MVTAFHVIPIASPCVEFGCGFALREKFREWSSCRTRMSRPRRIVTLCRSVLSQLSAPESANYAWHDSDNHQHQGKTAIGDSNWKIRNTWSMKARWKVI